MDCRIEKTTRQDVIVIIENHRSTDKEAIDTDAQTASCSLSDLDAPRSATVKTHSDD